MNLLSRKSAAEGVKLLVDKRQSAEKIAAQTLAPIFFDTIRNGANQFHSNDQNEAWASNIPHMSRCAVCLSPSKSLVAQVHLYRQSFLKSA